MTSHFSLDIETLDTRATAVVLSIGICKFDPLGVDSVGPFEHVALEVGTQVRNHRTVSSDTFYWWADQLVKMDANPFPKPHLDVKLGLAQIIDFIYGNSEPLEPREGEEVALYQDAYMWVRGPHFDWTIVENLAIQVGVEWPIHYARVMDQRTFCMGETYDPPETGEVFVKHSALSDAITQAMFIQQVTARSAEDEVLPEVTPEEKEDTQNQ